MVKKSIKTPRATKARRAPNTMDDFKSAFLLVSVTINLAVLIGWLALKITAQYDEQIASFLFGN